ncbi:MAG: FkbM family methyltransferase [Candidatus Pacebacteria bacterium]|nr:FkbM family methyltransferase [Candidatus Paceibacterota bacterium]
MSTADVFINSFVWKGIKKILPTFVRGFLSRMYLQVLQGGRKIKLLLAASTYVQNWLAFCKEEMWGRATEFQLRLRGGIVITVRPHTYDAFIVHEVFRHQGYAAGFVGLERENSSTIVDLGGHIGSLSLFAAEQYSQARVVSVEAVPENARLLQKNITDNTLGGRVTVLPYAVGEKSGSLTIYLRSDRTAQHSALQKSDTSVTVPCLTLEEVFTKAGVIHCDLLKLDIEGSEYAVLMNAPLEVLKCIDRMVMEYHLFAGVSPDDLMNFLSRNGFIVYINTSLKHLYATRLEPPDSELQRMGYKRFCAI